MNNINNNNINNNNNNNNTVLDKLLKEPERRHSSYDSASRSSRYRYV